MIISKSIDLLEKSEPGEMKKFHKPAKELLILKILKMQWNEKINAQQEEAYSDKEKPCLKDESIKYYLLEKLKKGRTCQGHSSMEMR